MGHVKDLWWSRNRLGKRVQTDRHGTRGKRWQASWIEAGKQRRARVFSTKDAAMAHLASVDVEQRKGTYVSPVAGRTTLNDVWPDWWATKAARTPKTREGYLGIWTKHVRTRWGDTAVGDVTDHAVARWLGELQSSPVSLSGSQTQKILLVLQGILATAVKMRLIPATPLTEVKRPAASGAPRRYLTVEQVARLAELSPSQRVEIWTLATCGLRRGELWALTVGDLDTRRSRLLVHAGVTWAEGAEHLGETKGHKSRDVPVPASVLAMLTVKASGRARSDILLPAPDGRRWNPSTWRIAWDAARAQFEIPDLDTHELRHSAVSLAIQSGANVKAIQRMVGHASAALTLDVYGGLWDDHLDDVAVRMDGLVAEAVRLSEQIASVQNEPELAPISGDTAHTPDL